MADTSTREARSVRFTVSLGEPIVRLLEELAIATRTLNRSELVREALIEKGDRVLPSDWRETVGLDGEAA